MAAKFLGEPTVITGSHDRTLKIWDLRSTETKFAGSSCNDLVTSDGAGSTIISGHYDKRIRFWDIRTEMSANHIVLQGKVTSLDLSRVGAADGAAYVWNTHSGKLEATLKDHTWAQASFHNKYFWIKILSLVCCRKLFLTHASKGLIEAPAEPLDETESDNGEVFDFLRGMTTGIINRFT
ncbi:hypothetical protein MSG28_008076 [Choristoneura fumiferana]|uniref:Uncharacterized protein n=1 Tax=Choristoneura fumiferana TaxID=7141 RepID=A0ACC0J9T1_CHOFU|nr:hypothetical protein MSG28_008076 [Choristoneura fumiferana]